MSGVDMDSTTTRPTRGGRVGRRPSQRRVTQVCGTGRVKPGRCSRARGTGGRPTGDVVLGNPSSLRVGPGVDWSSCSRCGLGGVDRDGTEWGFPTCLLEPQLSEEHEGLESPE